MHNIPLRFMASGLIREYFTGVLNRLAYISPNAPDEVYRELLPDHWTKK
ncbi:MAG: hypothetical protein AB2L20_00085 [Mangrovibacterium sp.]